jgi:hypothetical protein
MDVCREPCNIPVDPNGWYRVGGGSVRPTEVFRMPRSSGDIIVDAKVRGRGRRVFGIIATIAGAALAAAGTVTLSSGTDPSGERTPPSAGAAVLVGGGVVAAIGIWLWATSGSAVEVR